MAPGEAVKGPGGRPAPPVPQEEPADEGRPSLQEGARAPRHLYLSRPWSPDGSQWSSALIRELRLRQPSGDGWTDSRRELDSMHVGGDGVRAPSPSELRILLREGGLVPALGGEVALEVEPAEADPGTVDAWIRSGVTRLNLRRPVPGVPDEWPHDRGFHRLSSWGVDIPFGSMGDGHDDATVTLEAILLRWAPPQVSLVEEGIGPVDDDALADLYLRLTRRLEEAGYRQWAFTAFALPGAEPVHQRAVLEGFDYLGVGPGAHSQLRGCRFWNLDDPAEYLSKLGERQDPRAGEERPDAEQRLLEALWRSLNLAEGVDLRPSGLHHARCLRDDWVSAGFARPGREGLQMTPSGWLVLDALVPQLADSWPRGVQPRRMGPRGFGVWDEGSGEEGGAGGRRSS